jgi:hypothetical protein
MLRETLALAQYAGPRERVLEFLAEYGEKGYAVLRAALEAAGAGKDGRGVGSETLATGRLWLGCVHGA